MQAMTTYPQVRTSADILQSIIRVEELIPFLQQQNTKACAIVNSKLYGLLPFYQALHKANIHAVMGLTVEVQLTGEVILPIVLYAENAIGYANLVKITSAANIEAQNILPLRWLQGYAQGCLALMPLHTPQWQQISWQNASQQLQAIFADRLYCGISELDDEATSFMQQQNISVVATQECRYLVTEHAEAYRIARSIASNAIQEAGTTSYAMPTKAQWQERFTTEYLANTEAMLLRCNAQPTMHKPLMPKYPLIEGQNAEALLQQDAQTGLLKKLACEQLPTQYAERLQYELEVITKMGYADYFLIVADFMAYAQQANILTGPGRGSSASSLVAYALGITQVDPLRYGLLFERFLNPERVSLPDIDIDFVDTRRMEVIQYVAQKYGANYVAQISTFGTLAARAVAREVARAMQFSGDKISAIAKLLPTKAGVNLQQAYKENPALQQFIFSDPSHEQWWQIAQQLEGLPRSHSIHAAGIVLAPVPIVQIAPIEAGNDDLYATQWPMQEVEASGLVKMDFLGLRNLTILAQMRWLLYRQTKRWLDFEKIPLTDEATFNLLQNTDTLGIFQLESAGMQQALRSILPSTFLDIAAVSALYRPGPMAFIEVYAKRKHGVEPVIMPHPDLAPILQETFGVIVYQEQILQIAARFAGFTMGQADLLRRAVGKKNRIVLQQQQQNFISGAMANGYSEQVAKEIYDLIIRFADYGFVKSHAVAYSLISYRLAYIKARYPAVFYAAMLTNYSGDADKTTRILQEAKAKGITLLAPSIQYSERYYTVEKNAIRIGLAAIKSVPKPFIDTLLQERKANGLYDSLFDVALRLSAENFNDKAITACIYAGALDDFAHTRATLLATVEAAKKQAKIQRPNTAISLADAQKFQFGKLKHITAEPLDLREQLEKEKSLLGFYISEHPMDKMRQQYPYAITTQALQHTRAGTPVQYIGNVQKIHVIRTKKGEQMAFIELEDEFGIISVTLFPSVYKHCKPQLVEHCYLQVDAIVEVRSGKVQLQAKQLRFIEQ